MRVFISSSNVPIGYSPPEFPSLFWPLGPQKESYDTSFLYFSGDMWKFTVYWTLLLFGGFYFVTGTLAALIQIRNRWRFNKTTMSLIEAMILVGTYTLVGLFQGFVGGAVIGLLLSSIYKAGALSMSTWIPFLWAIAQIFFNVCSSYSLSSVLL